ncbi:MAG: hypothetical protein Ct9H300mP2_5390 [Candidatus Neomarinimicrobiota bacterium]|nr:MAG: hypothetical protein Ct9H300mP2_5390 [Candidatus Neomarinimicrobiota bacterium]
MLGGKREKDTRTEMIRTVTTFDDFVVGDMVEHSIFGVGKIMALSGGGENQRVGLFLRMVPGKSCLSNSESEKNN